MIIYDKKLDELREYENNPRNNENAVAAVAASIKEFGFKVPIVIDKDGVIIAGHTRVKAAQRLGLQTVPCIVADDLTDWQIRAFRLADNKTGELAGWDFEKLEAELAQLQEMDMSAFGFDIFEMDDPQEVVEDEAPEVDEESEPRCKAGDIWQLGRHRLMCGDSTDPLNVQRLLQGQKADLVLTDPPYGVNIVQHETVGGDKPFGRTRRDDGAPIKMGATRGEAKNAILKARRYIPIKGDETTETAKLNYEIVKELSAQQIIFGGNYFTDFLPPSRCWIVWDKGVPKEAFFAPVELAWCSKDGNAKLYKHLWSGICRQGDRAVEGKARMHPTQKPVGLLAEILKDFTKENDVILDCFGGSGSTLMACEQTERSCYMIEFEAHYCDVIIKRWETLTGETAVLVNE